MTVAYLNGEYIPLKEARVSVMDRGFLFGDGIYEMIPVYDGVMFRFDEHIERMLESLTVIRIDCGIETHELREILEGLVQRNGSGDQSVYLQITRGAADIRSHCFDKTFKPTIFAYSFPLVKPSIKELSQGIVTITLEDIRWKRCDIKAITLLPNILCRQQAEDAGRKKLY